MIAKSTMIAASVFALSHVAHAGPDNVAPPIVGGITTSDFAAVGAMMACEGATCDMYCSATLIHNEWIVTAAHCINILEDSIGDNVDHYFTIGDDIHSVTAYDQIVDWAVHPEYVNDDELNNDIAVARLSQGIDNITPIALNDEILGQELVGTELTFVGYGVANDNHSGGGFKRTADMSVDDLDQDYIYAEDDIQSLCDGDSGGAALEISQGETLLVAVNAFIYGVNASADTCDAEGAGATRIDTHLDFITTHVDLNVTVPLTDANDWNALADTADGEANPALGCSSAPTAPTLGMVALALGLIGFRRRD